MAAASSLRACAEPGSPTMGRDCDQFAPQGGLATMNIAFIDSGCFWPYVFLLHSFAILAAGFVKSLNKVSTAKWTLWKLVTEEAYAAPFRKPEAKLPRGYLSQ